VSTEEDNGYSFIRDYFCSMGIKGVSRLASVAGMEGPHKC